MARLRDLSGDQVADILGDFGFRKVAQYGPNIKVQKNIGRGRCSSMTFPLAKQLDRLALTAIYHEASQYVQETRLHQRFYE